MDRRTGEALHILIVAFLLIPLFALVVFAP